MDNNEAYAQKVEPSKTHEEDFDAPRRNLLSSTALTALLGWSVHRPNLILFMIGWPTLNLWWLTKSYPSLFTSNFNKVALMLNAWGLSKGAAAFWEALGARESFVQALRDAGIKPRAGSSVGKLWSVLALIPLFHASRRGRTLRISRNIPYASIAELDGPLLESWKRVPPFFRNMIMVGRGRISQWLSFDVIRLGDAQIENAPVLMAIHGGAWALADKLYSAHALWNRVASRGIVICVVNYRMSPERAWPTHIQDCKRALIFLKQNAHLYGGNPNQIFVTGESAGGHLACLLAITVGFREFNPPEEPTADVSVRGALPLYGVHDLSNSSGHSAEIPLFASKFVLQKPLSQETWAELERASPVFHARQMATAINDPKLCPFFIPHGTRDVLTSYRDATVFYELLQQLRKRFPLPNGDKDIFITLDGAHHAFGYFPSLRSNALGDAMADFIFHHSRDLGTGLFRFNQSI